MKLYTCSMHDCTEGKDILLGIFSSRDKAKHQAQIWLSGLNESFDLIDYDNEYDFFETASNHHYSAHYEEFNLNELSF